MKSFRLLLVAVLAVVSVAGSPVLAAECDDALTSFPNIEVGNVDWDPRARDTLDKIEAEFERVAALYYQRAKPAVADKTWKYPSEHFGTDAPTDSELQGLVGLTVAGFEGALFTHDRTPIVDAWKRTLVTERKLHPEEWRVSRIFFEGTVMSVRPVAEGGQDYRVGVRALLAVKDAAGNVRNVVANLNAPYLTHKHIESHSFLIQGAEASYDQVLRQAIVRMDLVTKIGREHLGIAAKFAELFGSLPPSYASTGIVKILRGKSKKFTKHPYFGILAGKKSISDRQLMGVGQTVAKFLEVMRIRTDERDFQAPEWIPNSKTVSEKASMLASVLKNYEW